MRFIINLLFLLVSALAATKVVQLTDDNFKEIILDSNLPALVEFYAPWCGHCKKLAPFYEDLATAFEGKRDEVIIAQLDGDKHKKYAEKYGVKGFPTLKYFDGKSSIPIDYTGGRTFADMAAFVTVNSGVLGKSVSRDKFANLKAEILNDDTFDAVVKDEGKDVFVFFTSSSCTPCDYIYEVFEKLSSTFDSEKDLKFVLFDLGPSTKVLKEKLAEAGNLVLYKKGNNEAVQFDEKVEADAVVEFLNKHTGSSRSTDGALSDQAGLIPSLNELAQKVASGQAAAADIIEELKERSASVESNFKDYYLRVASKLAESSSYVETELKRLEKMLSGTSLSKVGRDHAQIRSNILKVFRAQHKDEL